MTIAPLGISPLRYPQEFHTLRELTVSIGDDSVCDPFS